MRRPASHPAPCIWRPSTGNLKPQHQQSPWRDFIKAFGGVAAWPLAARGSSRGCRWSLSQRCIFPTLSDTCAGRTCERPGQARRRSASAAARDERSMVLVACPLRLTGGFAGPLAKRAACRRGTRGRLSRTDEAHSPLAASVGYMDWATQPDPSVATRSIAGSSPFPRDGASTSILAALRRRQHGTNRFRLTPSRCSSATPSR